MADSYLGYQNPSSVDEKLDTEELTIGANDVHRERVQIAGTGATDIAPVSATDGLLVDLGSNNDVTIPGVVSTANSTTTLLGVDEVFTGTGEDVLNYRAITVSIKASDDAAAVSVQFSSDNSNWDHAVAYTVTSSAVSFTFTPKARYYRIVYTNGGQGQSSFRLQSILHPIATFNTNTLNTTPSNSMNALPVTAVMYGKEASTFRVPVVDSSNRLSVALDGASVTVALPTGAATSAKQDTQTTELTSIKTAVETIDNAIAGAEMQVDVVTSALPSGAATSANQATVIGHLDGVEGLLTTIDGDTGNISTKIDTLAGAVAGTEMQVDVLTMPTTTVQATNLDVRDLVAASDAVSVHGDVGILDQIDLTNSNPAAVAIVDGNGDQITSFGGGTQYTEDAAAAANPVGTAISLVRQDTPAALVTTDGDNVAQRGTNYGAGYVQVVSSAGAFVDTFGGGSQYTEGDADATITGTAAMMEVGANTLQPVQGTVADGLLVNLGSNNDVTVASSALPTGASTLAEQQTQTTHLATIAGDTTDIEAAVELIDDTVAVLGTTTYTEAATKGLIIGAVRRDADTTLIDTTNEIGPIQMDARGFVKTEVFSGETLPVSLTSTTVTGTVAVTQSGLWDEVGINDSGNSITVDATDLDIRNLTNTDVVTAELSATDNAVLDAIAASVAAIDTDATTIIGHVDGLETSNSAIQTAVQLIDDSVQVLGTDTYTEASSKGITLGAVRRDADTTLVNTTNEFTPLQVDANGRLKVEAFSGETLPVSLTSTTVTGTVAVTQSGTWDEVGINDSGNSITVDNGGTFAVQGTAVGTIADDSTTPGAPVMTGGTAKNFDGTDPGNVSAEDDVTRVITDRNRRQYVNTVHPMMWSYHSDGSSALTDATVVAAPGANMALFVTDIVVSTGAATALNVFFEEGASKVLGPYYLEAVAGRGLSLHFTTPKKITTNTALTVTTSAAIAQSVDVTGFTARVD